MQTTSPQPILFNIKIKIAGQRIEFSAPYQNRGEALSRIGAWLEQYFSDSETPTIFKIMRAKPH